ncbi:hypothetical protein [Saccharococcus caldoxylosilyticus]|uniref:Guanylate cyclase domain-containing protein n=1 Tax=Parageobacillus caldoxylosilyticus NBRC 107762 TaxID=1220594 RepID=A0A023DK64_9BACL|nr:hypothetical protein [Parageobacillus caldoxylosilyticus]MBB3854516.1 hypothetical protein [Parageobacillus caldoxylosilyticus]GAJ41662.1 hypothetical protein GCA01S_084_00050 [Parageobacillus caldoxylosilyticus NBRC 107762]
MKASKYLSIVQKNPRYRVNYNPIYAILEGLYVQKSSEELQHKYLINEIINEELTKDFKIGGHPDYDYLLNEIKEEKDFYNENNQVANVKLCSLFIDLRNFTKRALFVQDPGIETIQEIAKLKQKAISTWIKLARYYQGHIHSITGDGLMVLIGGKKPEDEDEWTIGARAFLIALRVLESADFLNDELKQTLIEKGKESYATNSHNLLNIKVGIEYSPETLMNPQGVIVNINGEKKPVGEVKATAFEIDFSAKLLGYYNDAEKKLDGSPKYGRILLFGEKYKELMDFNDEIDVVYLSEYSRQMFDTTQTRKLYYMDCKELKYNIITLEDVAKKCNVYNASETAKNVSINIAREEKIQHG